MASRRSRTILVASAGLLAIAAAIKFLLREPRIDIAAENYARAVCRGDMRFLAKYIPQYELDKLGISRDQAMKILELVAAPKLAGIKFDGITQRIVQQGGISGIALYNVRLRTGKTLQMVADL